VAEDHPLYREGLVRVLKARPDIEVVADVSTGRDALEAVLAMTPDVAVLDIALPDIDGITVLETVERESRTLVVFLSAHDDSPTVYRALSAGARGYLPKASSADDICDTVMAVGRGETVIPRELQTGLRQELRLHKETRELPALSPRELEILRLAAQGRSITEMAGDLNIAVTTVKTHLRHIYDKLEAPDRTAAVAQAFRHGLLH
jgi:two-component system nitrate/nitrite response regulator NarL